MAWFNSSDRFLSFLAAAGTLASLLILLGIATAPALIAAWLAYLSLVTVGGDFMSFQWDILLLETGFLAIFFSSWRLLAPHWRRRAREHIFAPQMPNDVQKAASIPASLEPAPPLAILWLLRWLLFRLLFMSGAVKLLSNDPSWRNLTALDYHYYAQPLPTPVAWYMAQLPSGFQKLSVFTMFFIELGVPFLIFAPRRLRHMGAALIIFFQVLIGVTGNYTFFNLLTIALCVLLFDDAMLRRSLSMRVLWACFARSPRHPLNTRGPDTPFADQESQALPASESRTRSGHTASGVIRTVVAVVIFVTSAAQEIARLSRGSLTFQPAMHLLNVLEPFRIVNGYGLFAVMTTTRLEIIVQGSNDGKTWLDYGFKYKPQDVKRPPRWVEPHQPRLDWQMWFAALGNYGNNPWFVNFMVRLLEGSPEVVRLLGRNPFPKVPPRFIRAVVYEYRFTDFATRRRTGDWWQREFNGSYFPVVSLKAIGQAGS